MKVTTAEDIARMMGKFRGKVDYSDAPNGFFGYVREIFEQLAHEEERAGDYEGVRVPDYPSFGHKGDSYEDVARNFYSIWNGFATVKTFAHLDVYRTSEAPDRRYRRAMEKENKKFREEGVRQFNDAVRTLVAFVRKRDPRFTPIRQSEEEAAKAQREARNAQAARSRAAHAAKIQQQDDAVPAWAQAREPDEVDEETESEIEEEHFECVACKKTFKSERQFDAHEKSKKHQKAVYALRKKMQKDNAHLNLDDDVPPSSGIITPVEGEDETAEDAAPGSERDARDASADDVADNIVHLKVEEEEEEEEESTDNDTPSAQPPDSLPNPTTQQPKPSNNASSDTDSEASSPSANDDYASRSDIEARLAAPSSTHFPTDAPEKKKLGAAKLKKAKKKAAKQTSSADEESGANKCVSCKEDFPSKTQLFQHLKKNPKHAAPVSIITKGAAKKGKNKK